MRPFLYERVDDVAVAVRSASQPGAHLAATATPATAAPVQFLAGGTNIVDLMKLDTMRPETLVDINGLRAQHGRIEAGPQGLRLGALVRMSEAADDATVQRDYPVIAQSLQLAASAQLRNMASLAGNVLQRTRCEYFRQTDYLRCNKRVPGSGCDALEGANRMHAVLGVGEQCISSYPGDFAQALVALDVVVETAGPGGTRTIRFEELHRPLSAGPENETVLAPGELITAFVVPAGPWTRRSTYIKVRDRESYEYGAATAAVALDIEGGVVRTARIGLGGVAYKPWRAHEAEAALHGKPLTEATADAAARIAFASAQPRAENAYKVELGRHTLVRALLHASQMEA